MNSKIMELELLLPSYFFALHERKDILGAGEKMLQLQAKRGPVWGQGHRDGESLIAEG